MKNKKIIARKRRAKKVRNKIVEHGDIRLSIHRTNANIYAQIIDDTSGTTLCMASTIEKDGKVEAGSNCTAAKAIGERLASKAKSAGIKAVVFDRNGYKFHGRVKALADGAREGGLKF